METNQLKQFCTVVETQNLRKAAEILGMSHSALSKSLKNLQISLQKKLTIQVGRNIAITEEGYKLYPKAKELLNYENKLKEIESDNVFKLRIGTFEVFSTHFLGSLWKNYFDEVALELYELLPGALEQALLNRIIDIGITYEPIPTAGIEFTKLGHIEMGIYKRAKSFAHTSLADLPFVAPLRPITSIPNGTKGLDGWPDHEFSRKVIYSVDMMESALAIARQGLAALFIPHFIARIHNLTVKNDYQLIPVFTEKMKPVKRKIYLVTRSNFIENSYAKKLTKMIRVECLQT
jgi:DNA-binding transcriptional LysR family regulator